MLKGTGGRAAGDGDKRADLDDPSCSCWIDKRIAWREQAIQATVDAYNARSSPRKIRERIEGLKKPARNAN